MSKSDWLFYILLQSRFVYAIQIQVQSCLNSTTKQQSLQRLWPSNGHCVATAQQLLSVATMSQAIEDSPVSANSALVHIFHRAPSPCQISANRINKRDTHYRIHHFASLSVPASFTYWGSVVIVSEQQLTVITQYWLLMLASFPQNCLRRRER